MRVYPKFLLSAMDREHFPSPSAPEVAFLGRSNVGKSSLINALLGSDQARVSQTPGRTRAINFFAVADSPTRQQPRWIFADLPGSLRYDRTNRPKDPALRISTYSPF